MLKTRNVSKTRSPTSRQTKSAKHHHPSIQSHSARTCYSRHLDLFAILVQQDCNGHEHAGEEHAPKANPKVVIRRSGEEEESRAEYGVYKVVSG